MGPDPKHELHRQHSIGWDEIHDHIGRVIGAGAGNGVEVGIVVVALRIRTRVGLLVRTTLFLVRKPSGSACRKDHARIARRDIARDFISL